MSHKQLRILETIKDSCRAAAAAKSWVELNPESHFQYLDFQIIRTGPGAKMRDLLEVRKAGCEESSAWEGEIRREGLQSKGEISAPGTLRRERLERAATEIRTIGRRCHHGEWLR